MAFEALKGDDPKAVFAPRRLNIVCADIRFLDGQRREEFLALFRSDRPLLSIVQYTLHACENAYSIGGYKLGFWFAQQGSIYVFVAIIFFYAWRMNRLDRQFDVHED